MVTDPLIPCIHWAGKDGRCPDDPEADSPHQVIGKICYSGYNPSPVDAVESHSTGSTEQGGVLGGVSNSKDTVMSLRRQAGAEEGRHRSKI